MTGPGDRLAEVLGAIETGEAPVEVVGHGALAEAVRERLDPPGSGSEPPCTIVDTTGELAEFEDVLARVDDLGTVVLAGPAVTSDSSVDLYADLHVRGLAIVAIAPTRAMEE
jgi:hypothetical protein